LGSPVLSYDRMPSWGWASRDGTRFFYTPEDENKQPTVTELLVVGKDKPVYRFEYEKFGRVASMSADNRFALVYKQAPGAHIWDLKSDKSMATFTAPDGALYHADLSPDGKHLIAVCGTAEDRYRSRRNQMVICWEIATKAERFRLTGWGNSSVSYSPGGEWLIAAEDTEILVLAAKTGKLVHRLRGHGRNLRFASRTFTADDKRLITNGSDGTIIIWDLVTGKPALDFDSPRGMEGVLALSPDGKTLFTGEGLESGLWDADTGKRKHRLDPQQWSSPFVAAIPLPLLLPFQHYDALHRRWYAGGPSAAVFTADGQHIIVGRHTATGSSPAQLWSVADGTLIREFPGHKDMVGEARLSPNGKHLATWDRDTGKVRLWELDTGKLVRESQWVGKVPDDVDGRKTMLATHDAILAWTKDNEVIGVATELGKKRNTEVTNLSTGKVLGKWTPGERASPKVISSDGRVVALLESKRGEGDRIVVRRLATGEAVCDVPKPRDGPVVPAISFSPTSKLLAVAGTIYDAETGREIRTLRGHNGGVAGVAFSPYGKRLATGGYDSTVLIWDLLQKP
ncbi:MAG: hypothetical protein U0792_22575, partial [Gemmataceae bacterium]